MKIINLIILLSTIVISTFAQETPNSADCLILKDENSIICKYTQERVDLEKDVTFQWIDPNGEISRERVMKIPPHHGSVYDYRYIKGRALGKWTFKVIDGQETYSANFTLE